MTEDTSRYYFVTGPRRGHTSGVAAERLLEIIKMAFEEDGAMIESQAANIKLNPAEAVMMTSADVAPVMFRSTIRALIKAEQGVGIHVGRNLHHSASHSPDPGAPS